MSLPSILTNRRVKQGSAAVLGLTGVFVVASLLAPVSGAYFIDAKSGHVTTTTKTLSLTLAGDGTNQAGFDLAFDDLVPGQSSTDSFVVENTGAIDGHAMLSVHDLQLVDVGNEDLHHLTYWVEGFGTLPYDQGQGAFLDLGTIPAGQAITLNIRATLDETAGNEWQNATVSSAMEISLSQA